MVAWRRGVYPFGTVDSISRCLVGVSRPNQVLPTGDRLMAEILPCQLSVAVRAEEIFPVFYSRKDGLKENAIEISIR